MLIQTGFSQRGAERKKEYRLMGIFFFRLGVFVMGVPHPNQCF